MGVYIFVYHVSEKGPQSGLERGYEDGYGYRDPTGTLSILIVSAPIPPSHDVDKGFVLTLDCYRRRIRTGYSPNSFFEAKVGA